MFKSFNPLQNAFLRTENPKNLHTRLKRLNFVSFLSRYTLFRSVKKLILLILINLHLYEANANVDTGNDSCASLIQNQFQKILSTIKEIDLGKVPLKNLAADTKFYAKLFTINLERNYFKDPHSPFHENKNFDTLSRYIYLNFLSDISNHFKEALKQNEVTIENYRFLFSTLSYEKYKLKKKLIKLSPLFVHEFKDSLLKNKEAKNTSQELIKRWQKDPPSFGELFFIFGDDFVFKILPKMQHWHSPLPHLTVILLSEIFISLSSFNTTTEVVTTNEDMISENAQTKSLLLFQELATKKWLDDMKLSDDSKALLSYLKAKQYPQTLYKLKLAYLRYIDTQVSSIKNEILLQKDHLFDVEQLILELGPGFFQKKSPLDEFSHFINPPLKYLKHLENALGSFSKTAVIYYLHHLRFTKEVLHYLEAKSVKKTKNKSFLLTNDRNFHLKISEVKKLLSLQRKLIELFYQSSITQDLSSIDSLNHLKQEEQSLKTKLFSELLSLYPNGKLVLDLKKILGRI